MTRTGAAFELPDLSHSNGYCGQRLDDPANFHLVVAANRFTPDEVADVVVAAVPALSQTRHQAPPRGPDSYKVSLAMSRDQRSPSGERRVQAASSRPCSSLSIGQGMCT